MKKFKYLCLILILCLGQKGGILSTYAFELENNSQSTVYLEGEFLDGNLLMVKAKIEGIETPVIGTSFTLKFEPEKLAFLRYEPGDFLERGGDPFYLVTERENEGKLIIGQTLRHDNDYPVGEGVLIQAYFQILEEEEYWFEFENGAVSTIDGVRQDLDNIDWQNTVISRESISEEKDLAMPQISKSDKGFGINIGELNLRSFMWIFPLAMLFSTLLYLTIKEKKRHV